MKRIRKLDLMDRVEAFGVRGRIVHITVDKDRHAIGRGTLTVEWKTMPEVDRKPWWRR